MRERRFSSIPRDQSIFPKGRLGDLSVGWHNIDHILPEGASPTQKRKIQGRYETRGGALDWSRTRTGLLVRRRTQAITEHASYIGATSHREFKVYEMDDITVPKGSEPDTLVVPYVNLPAATNEVQEAGQESWGLPPEMVAALKNKVSFHDLVASLGVEGFEIPEYRIATTRNLMSKAEEILRESKKIYEKAGISDYPLGVVIRAEESDGNYGNSLVFEEKDKQIIVIPDGDKKRSRRFLPGSWNKALKFATKEITSKTGRRENMRMVVSRYMEIADSPGLSLILKNGNVESLGWNGQVQAEGTKACIGTAQYQTLNPHLKRLQKEFEDKSIEDFTKFLKAVAKKLNIPFDTINGIVNVDLMLPGQREMALRKARGKGMGYYVAESNPRWTNYTDAVLEVVGLTGRKPTPRDIQRVIKEGVHTIDRWHIGDASPGVVREVLFELDREGDAGRAFLRMPTSPEAGIILIGDIKEAETKVHMAIEEARRKVAL